MKILTPAERTQIRLQVEQQITIAITQGLMKVVGEDAHGKTLFAVTEKGQQRADDLSKSIVDSARKAIR